MHREIIELYAHRQPAYETAHVQRLLGITAEELAGAIAEGALTPEQNDAGATVLPWEDVAALAPWTPRMIAEALGSRASSALPPLHQYHTIPLCLPLYQVRLLGQLAGTGQNASDVIERLVHDHANTLDTVPPDLRRALEYPYYIPRAGALQRCRYCGIVLSRRGVVCRACKNRHEAQR